MKTALEDAEKTDAPRAEEKSLWEAFARGVRDNVVAELLVQVFRVGGIIVLARLLRPDDFGLLKVLIILTATGLLVCESGLPDALVQRKDLRTDHEITAWWTNLALSAGTSAFLYVFAPVIARLMAIPELVGPLRLLSVPILLEGSVAIAGARLRRDLRFGVLAAADVLGEITFLATAFVLLYADLPRWSLPGALAARYAGHAATIWLANRRVWGGKPRLEAARDLSGFAVGVLGGRIVSYASANIDYLLVGRLLGTGALGFYALAWDLLRFVPDRLYKVAGRVALPAFCRIQDDNRQLGDAYSNFVGYLSRIVLPVAGCAAIAAPELVRTIYGSRWVPAALPLRLLAPGLALVGMRVGIGSVYYAKGRPLIDICINGARLLLISCAVIVCSRWGLAGIAGSVSVVEAGVSVVAVGASCNLIELSVRRLLLRTIPGVRLAILCVVATAGGKELGHAANLHGLAMLLLIAVPPSLVFCWHEAFDLTEMLRYAFGRQGANPLRQSREQNEPAT